MSNIVWPLEGCADADPLEGGFGFLDPIGDGAGTVHPGVDLNAGNGGDADCGAAVVCPAPGVVRAVLHWDGITKGFGTHVWIEHDTGEWTHYCHLATAPVPVETRLNPGDVFATCGKTGGWPWCHTHFEVTHVAPPSWDFWPKGYSRAAVQNIYADPEAWLASQTEVLQEGPVSAEDQALLDAVKGSGINTVQDWTDLRNWTSETYRELQDTEAQLNAALATQAQSAPAVVKVLAPAGVQVDVEPSN